MDTTEFSLDVTHALFEEANIVSDAESEEVSDAIAVLVSFGYSLTEAKNAVKQAVKEIGIASAQDLIKGALNHIV